MLNDKNGLTLQSKSAYGLAGARSATGSGDESRESSRLPISIVLVGCMSLLVALRPEVFFSSLAFVGAEYSGSDSSPAYIGFVFLSSLMIYIIGVCWLLSSRRILVRHLLIFAMPILMVAIFLLDDALGRTQATSESHFMLALAFAGPAALAGMIFAQPNVTRSSAYAIEPLMLLFSLAVLFSAIDTLQGGIEDRGIGGATYQTASYLGAVGFILNFYYLLFGRSGYRPRITRTRAYSIISLILLPMQVGSVLLTGGRGGFVLLAIGTLVVTWAGLRAGRPKLLGRILMILGASIPILAWGIPVLLADPTTASIIQRVFSYVGDQGIDWSGTSGRDGVYQEALTMLEQAPFLGYGIFSWGVDFYPHNIWLELLLNGGILYALLWLFLLGVAICRAAQLWARFPDGRPIVLLMLYPAVLLQFSGTYWTSGIFWFSLAFLACAHTRQKPSARQRLHSKRIA